VPGKAGDADAGQELLKVKQPKLNEEIKLIQEGEVMTSPMTWKPPACEYKSEYLSMKRTFKIDDKKKPILVTYSTANFREDLQRKEPVKDY